MTLEETRSGLAELLLKLGDIKDTFSKYKYPANFEMRFHEAEDFLAELQKDYTEAEDPEAFLDAIADAPAAAAKAEMDKLPRKNQKDTLQMQFNLAMVTYVNPVILKYPGTFAEPLTDKIVEEWGRYFPKMKIKKASYETIMLGFKRKFCYITTAVCQSQEKPDDCYELEVLRRYRDEYLAATEEGMKQIEEYYDVAPTIVHRIDHKEDSARIYDDLYRTYIMPCITAIENQKYEDCRKLYHDMVEELSQKYLYLPNTDHFIS